MPSRKVVRKPIQMNTYVGFFLGGGATILAVALIGAAVVNGNWDEHNTFVNYGYGDQYTVHTVVCAIIGLSLFACVFAILAIWVGLAHPEMRCTQYVLWGISLAVFIGTVISEIILLCYTKYGTGYEEGFSKVLLNEYTYDNDENIRKYMELVTYSYEAQKNEVKYILDQFGQFYGAKWCNEQEWSPTLEDGSDNPLSAEAALVNCTQENLGTKAAWSNKLDEKCQELFGVERCTEATSSSSSWSYRTEVPTAVKNLVRLMSAIGMLPVNSSANGYSPIDDEVHEFSLSDFMFTARSRYGRVNLPYVLLNWTGIIMDGMIMSHDPCNYMFDNSYQIAAMGHWDAEKFRNYWCKSYRSQVHEEAMWNKNGRKTKLEMHKREFLKNREELGVYSIFALYEMNAIMLGLQVTGFVVIIMALLFDVGTQDRLLPEEQKTK